VVTYRHPPVDIIDYAQSPAQAVITKSQELKMTGQTSYFLKTEGDLGENKIAYVDPSIVRVHKLLFYLIPTHWLKLSATSGTTYLVCFL